MIWCGFSNPSAFSSRKSSALLISATMFFIPCSVLELKMHNSVPPPCSPYFLEHSDLWSTLGPASPSKVMMQKPNRHFGQNAKKGPKRAKKHGFSDISQAIVNFTTNPFTHYILASEHIHRQIFVPHGTREVFFLKSTLSNYPRPPVRLRRTATAMRPRRS